MVTTTVHLIKNFIEDRFTLKFQKKKMSNANMRDVAQLIRY